jgi:predicted alpha/beta-fold hydrolase
LQTIYAYYLTQTPNFTYRRERWETPDHDFIELDWLDASSEESRLLVMFHGLEGMFAESLRSELDEPTAPRRLAWSRAAFSWLRR